MQVFLDESGNTGTNWLDPIQRYFVYGGWIIQDKNLQSLRNLTIDIFKSNATELKSGYILKRKKPEFYSWIIQIIENSIAIPICVIANKEYMLAIKIVETFFDCSYNPRTSNISLEQKRELIDYLSSKHELLSKFQVLLSNGKIPLGDMKSIAQSIILNLKTTNLQHYSEYIVGLEDNQIKRMIEEFEILSQGGIKNMLCH